MDGLWRTKTTILSLIWNMMSEINMNLIKNAIILKNDPKIEFKKKAYEFFSVNVDVVSKDEKIPEIDFLDISSFYDFDIKKIDSYLEKTKSILISPYMASLLVKGQKEPLGNNSVYTAYPLRYWGVAVKIIEMLKENTASELTSLRIIWNLPGKLSSSEKIFVNTTLINLIDLSNYIVDSELLQLYIEKVKDQNNLFVLLRYKNNVVAELEVNEALPNSMDPARFLKAVCKEGMLTNMPLVGFHNEEGAVFADDKKATHPLFENLTWDGTDEFENLYLKMLIAIDEGSYPSGFFDNRNLVQAVNKSMKFHVPVSLEEL